MKIDKTINKWFDETKVILRKHKPQRDNIDDILFASIAIIDNYVSSARLLLENPGNERRLPAQALLRVSGEFIAKLKYCFDAGVKNKDMEKTCDRLESWRKLSLGKKKTFLESIVDRCNSSDRQIVEKWLADIESAIQKITVNPLCKTSDILKETFGKEHPVGEAGIYSQYHNSVHIDLETLESTICRKQGCVEYKGDVDYDIKGLIFECLTHVFEFLRVLYKYYNFDFCKIENEYKMLIPKS